MKNTQPAQFEALKNSSNKMNKGSVTTETKQYLEQDKYSAFILEILAKRLFESASELNKELVKKFNVNLGYARKILSRTVEANIIKSSRPYTFGKGQFVYLLKEYSLTIDDIIQICKDSRPPIFRLLSSMQKNGGIISYYEGMKITASPEDDSSTKVTNLKDIIKLFTKMNFLKEERDKNGVNYLMLKTSYDEDDLFKESAEELMKNHYLKMVVDCSLNTDIIRWLKNSNIISGIKVEYRNKSAPGLGKKHNNLLWDILSYTKTTGINDILGAHATGIEQQTLVVADVILSNSYDDVNLDGFISRLQININSVKGKKRKVLPIIIYRTCSAIVLGKIKKLGILSFDIGSIFGSRIYDILHNLNNVDLLTGRTTDIERTIKSILNDIHDSGHDDALRDLKGVLFEALMYPFLSTIYSSSYIDRGKILSLEEEDGKKVNYEYDYIITSKNPNEIVLVELKGYSSKTIVSLGDSDKKASIKWFFERTVPFAKKFYKKEISEGKKLKAIYITSGNFHEEGDSYLKEISGLKSENLERGYDRTQLLEILARKGFTNEIDIINKYY